MQGNGVIMTKAALRKYAPAVRKRAVRMAGTLSSEDRVQLTLGVRRQADALPSLPPSRAGSSAGNGTLDPYKEVSWSHCRPPWPGRTVGPTDGGPTDGGATGVAAGAPQPLDTEKTCRRRTGCGGQVEFGHPADPPTKPSVKNLDDGPPRAGFCAILMHRYRQRGPYRESGVQPDEQSRGKALRNPISHCFVGVAAGQA